MSFKRYYLFRYTFKNKITGEVHQTGWSSLQPDFNNNKYKLIYIEEKQIAIEGEENEN